MTENTLKPRTRNSNGLLDSTDYIFNEEGQINWRAMIKPEFLVPNLQKTTETDITKLKDSEILILLAGSKYLLNLRGYHSVSYTVVSASRDYCCVKCNIDWIPNYETENREVSFESIADAHADNTDPKMGINYLASIAENRAFVRCIRNFLRINILGKDELNGNFKPSEEIVDNKPEEAMTPLSILKTLMRETGISFEKIKDKLVKEGDAEAANYTSLENLNTKKLFKLIERLKEKKEKKAS